jgi:hypothetical protein
MRRFGVVIGVILPLLLVAATADAAGSIVTKYRFSGTFAEAEWFHSSSNSFTDTYVNLSTGGNSAELFVDRFYATFDSQDNFTGGTEVFADVTRRFTYSIDAHKLMSASVSGSSIRATRCVYDANFDATCTDIRIPLDISWTGQGPLGRGSFAEHFKYGDFSYSDHFHGTFRDATASGTLNGATLSASSLEYADLGQSKYGEVDICHGC